MGTNISFLEGVGFVSDQAMSDVSSWEKFISRLEAGKDNESSLQIWDDLYGPKCQALRLYIETTPSNSRYILSGESLRDGDDDWEAMADEDVGSWLAQVGISTRRVYGGGLSITLDELSKLPDAVASMRENFVKEVVESL